MLDNLVFRGGTALRLCYGALRYSEDLDFASNTNFTNQKFYGIKDCIERYIGERYDLAISVKEPKQLRNEPTYKDVNVNRWQVAITTSPKRKDLPKQKIKIEIADIKAYSRTPLNLHYNYSVLPDGYDNLLIFTETLDEIMADKLIAFVNCNQYIRHRDIWDLHWMMRKNVKINSDFICAKIKDYHISDYTIKLSKRISELGHIINSKAFHDEMSRFLPYSVLEKTLQQDKFLAHLEYETNHLLLQVKENI